MTRYLSAAVLSAFFLSPAHARIAVVGDTLAEAETLYRQATNLPRADCDPLADGRWICASFRNPRLSDASVPTAPVEPSPSPTPPTLPASPDERVAVYGATILEAQDAYRQATTMPRADCDRYGSGWLCASFDSPREPIIARALAQALAQPATSPIPATPTTPTMSAARVQLCDNFVSANRSIQNAVNQAKSVAERIPGNCSVAVNVPAGQYNITSTITVPSRVSLIGESFNDTEIHYVGKLHAIQIRNTDNTPASHVRIEGLGISMNGRRGDNPNLGGHCISSVRGMKDSEFRNLRLHGCDFYAIGMQQTRGSDAPYERVTVQNVSMRYIGSDAVDMKTLNGRNEDIKFLDICVQDIAYSDDGDWASALDLGGNNIEIDRFTFINRARTVNGTNTNGIDGNEGGRAVSNSTIGDFYIRTATQAVVFAPDQGNRNITFTKGGVIEDSTLGVVIEDTGRIDNNGQIFVTGTRIPLRRGDNDFWLSEFRPDSDFFRNGNPVCNY